jgi:hypothetical protein
MYYNLEGDTMFSFILSAVIATLPSEFVVDCSGWPGGKNEVNLTCRYECWDGRVVTDRVAVYSPGPGTYLVVETLAGTLKSWRFETIGKPGGETALVIRGSKTSPIKSVTFNGDGWTPVVTKRLVTQPPPNEPKK